MADTDDTAAETADNDEATSAEADDEETDDSPEPAVQSEAFRRQQLFVGSGVAMLGGIAVTIATLQQLPGVPFFAALLGGMLTSAMLFGLVFVGIFRSEGD